MRIADGRTAFYQWDMDQQLIVEEGITEVHFDNGTTNEALPCQVKEVDGERRVDVPNIFLQTAAQISAYAWDGSSVVGVLHIWVEPKAKPADYVYTQTEVLSVDAAVADALQKMKDSGELTGPAGPQGPQGPKGEPGAPGPAEVFIAEYGVTTFAEMEEAYNAGKLIFCRDDKYLVPMYDFIAGASVSFYRVTSVQIVNYYRTASGKWNSKVIEMCGAALGDIATALDEIIAIQNSLIGGDDA